MGSKEGSWHKAPSNAGCCQQRAYKSYRLGERTLREMHCPLSGLEEGSRTIEVTMVVGQCHHFRGKGSSPDRHASVRKISWPMPEPSRTSCSKNVQNTRNVPEIDEVANAARRVHHFMDSRAANEFKGKDTRTQKPWFGPTQPAAETSPWKTDSAPRSKGQTNGSTCPAMDPSLQKIQPTIHGRYSNKAIWLTSPTPLTWRKAGEIGRHVALLPEIVDPSDIEVAQMQRMQPCLSA